jgi:hypothetical protein
MTASPVPPTRPPELHSIDDTSSDQTNAALQPDEAQPGGVEMRRQHSRSRPHEEPEVAAPLDPRQQEEQEEARSLDLVQRMIVSALVIVIYGAISAGLTAYITLNPDDLSSGSVIVLWLIAGFAGLLTAATVLVINRRHPYSPLLVLGLLPTAISAYWVLT